MPIKRVIAVLAFVLALLPLLGVGLPGVLTLPIAVALLALLHLT